MAEPETGERGRPKQPRRLQLKPSGSRIEVDSVLYSRLMPLILGCLALTTVILIIVAAGVLIGVIPFR